jgi:hypothetical protein
MMAALAVGLVLLNGALAQSGAAGLWQAEYTGSEGRVHRFTLTLQVEPDGTIAGTISSPRGSVAITEGTVQGDEISFTVRRRATYDQIDVVFTGRVDGDRMHLTMRAGSREPVAVAASREKAVASTKPRQP